MLSKAVIALFAATAVLLADIQASCPSDANGITLSNFQISQGGIPVSSLSPSGGTYTLAGTVTIASSFASHSSYDLNVYPKATVGLSLGFIVSQALPCDACTLTNYNCPNIESKLGVTSNTFCNSQNQLQVGSYSFSVPYTVQDFSSSIPGSAQWAKVSVTFKFKPHGSSEVIGCFTETLDIDVN